MTTKTNFIKQNLYGILNSGGSHKDQAEKYRIILDSILTGPESELVECLQVFIEAIVNENVSLVISRQILSDISMHLVKLPDAISRAVSHYTLDKVRKVL